MEGGQDVDCGGRDVDYGGRVDVGLWREGRRDVEEWEGGTRIFRLPGCVDNQGLLHLGAVDPLGEAEEHEAGEPVGAGGGSAEPALAGAVPVQQLAELGVHHEGVQLGVVPGGQH